MAEASLLPAYLIVGADEYKRSRAVERMKARLEKSGMAAFNLDERDMTRDPAIDDIIASLNTFPMGTDFRLVILDGCDRLPKAVSEPLVEYFADPSPPPCAWCGEHARQEHAAVQGYRQDRQEGRGRLHAQENVGDAQAGRVHGARTR